MTAPRPRIPATVLHKRPELRALKLADVLDGLRWSA